MKLTVLVDNNTYIDQYYCAEPALSYLIEDGAHKILFDTGYSGLLIQNAEAMQLDLATIDSIVISHGHNDHTRGLSYLSAQYDLTHVKLFAHPAAFHEKIFEGLVIGAPVSVEDLSRKCQLHLSKTPVQISPNVFFLGEIPEYTDFEQRQAFGQCQTEGIFCDDYVVDDSALVYQTEQGIYIISGCAHSGICNTIEHAKKITGETRVLGVLGVLGGFHLFDVDERLHKTIAYFVQNNIQQLYPCHCVSFVAKAEIHQVIAINEVGVGLTVSW